MTSRFRISLSLGLVATAASLVLALPSKSPAADDAEADAYVLRVGDLSSTQQGAVKTALAKVGGVANVTVEPEKKLIRVNTGTDKLLGEAQVRSVLKGQKIDLQAFEVPSWAMRQVYVVAASGGG
jgi:copper chaperone CopZ